MHSVSNEYNLTLKSNHMIIDINVIADGIIQMEIQDKAKGVHFIASSDNVHAFEVLTSVKTLNSYKLMMN